MVLPILLDLADELTNLDDIYDDYSSFGDFFGLRRRPALYLTYPKQRYCPYAGKRNRRLERSKKDKELTNVGKDGFQACMDVGQFKPNELNVKTVDNSIVIEGKHDEREDDHGFISRHFIRRYILPKGYDPKEVVSTLSSDGVLTVKAPPPQSKKQKEKERVIQIQQTGPAHLNIKDNSSEKPEEEKMES